VNDYVNPSTDAIYSIGDIMTIMWSVVFAASSLGQAGPLLKTFTTGKMAAAKIFECIDRKPEIQLNDPTKKTQFSIEGQIEFKNVKFSYPTKKEKTILHYLSMSIQKNTKIAIVGESGYSLFFLFFIAFLIF